MHAESEITTATGHDRRPTDRAGPIAVLVAVVILLATGAAWWLNERHAVRDLQRQTDAFADILAAEIERFVGFHLRLIDEFAARWQAAPPTDESSYIDTATTLTDRFPAFQAINWIDRRYTIRYVAPLKGNIAAQGADLRRHRIAGRIITEVFETGKTRATPVLELLQGGKGFAVYQPVTAANGDVIGAINGVFRLRILLAGVLGALPSANYAIRLSDRDVVIYEDPMDRDPAIVAGREIATADRRWRLDISPRPNQPAAGGRFLAPLIVTIGVLSAAVAGATTYVALHRNAGRRRAARLEREENPVAMIDTANCRFLDVNEATERLFGIEREELLLLALTDLAPEFQPAGRPSADHLSEMIAAALGGSDQERELVLRHADGTLVPSLLRLPARPDHPTQIDCYLIDISEQRRLETRFKHLATHDPLTGLPNSALFHDRLQQAVSHAKRYDAQIAVLACDITGMKQLNETHGETIGDEVLRTVASRLRASMRDKDTVARTGPDEFGLILADIDNAEGAAYAAQRIQEAMDRAVPVDRQNSLKVDVRIGIALYPNDARAPEQLQVNADAALFRCREDGPAGYCFFVQSLNSAMSARQSQEGALKNAIDQGAFQIAYQPRFRLADEGVSGLEALLRWQADADKPPRLPETFLAAAERTGLTLAIGKWMISEIFTHLAGWRAGGLPLVPVAVNLSSRQLANPDLLPHLLKTAADHDIDPGLIEIDVSEIVAMRDPEQALGQLYRFAEAGVSVTLDNVGSATLSLRHLQRFPLRRLKIDRALMAATTPHSSGTLPIAIAALGKALKLRVVAVGVETEAQRDRARATDCDEVQGFLYARPMPAESVNWYLARRTTADA